MKPTVAEITSDPDEPHLLPSDARPGPSRPAATRRSSTAPRRCPSSRPSTAGPWCSTTSTPGIWPATRLVEVRNIDDDDFVVAFVPRNREVLEFIRRVKAGRPARRGPHPRSRRGPPVEPFLPVVVREQFALMPRLESLSVVKGEHVCTNDDLIRNAAYSWSPMTADEIQEKTGIEERRYTERRSRAHLAAGGPGRARGRRAPAGGDRGGHLLLVHQHEAHPVGRDLALRAARDVPDARLVRPRRRLRRASRTAWLRRCASSRRWSARCSSVCAEKFSDKIGNVRTSRMIFGDGAAALVVGPAAPGAPPTSRSCRRTPAARSAR